MKKIRWFILLILTIFFLFFEKNNFKIDNIFAATSTTVHATIKITVCGNNIKEDNEDCDGIDLAGKTCQNFGYTRGTLSCLPSCDFNFSSCISGGGGGGGGGGGSVPVPTSIIFEGNAYPKSNVILLKDGQVALETIAGPNAKFSAQLSGISSGSYIFSIYSQDKNGMSSSLFTFPVNVTQGAATKVSGIFISPTILVDKSEVKWGDNITIFGQSAPLSEITIVVNSENEEFVKTKSDKDGAYLYNFDTSILEKGEHLTRSKAALDGEITTFGKAVSFLVGDKNILITQKKNKANLNNDNKINLVDFSIAAYWYKRSLGDSFLKIEKEFLNGDGKIDLIDFSITAFYWTG